ncbi:LADA_0G09846g1_1 [Lachancea dasiensis]|uniref:LADA_0G09846g1_1 n=1 Tax=Lachancea dasiensis TaxID=1072105 RepID=A0A1G4JUK8_9SACH|nr:LADA_0G09846g1_1 [Lachancea dasiensis]
MCGRYALDCTGGQLERRFTEMGLDFTNERGDTYSNQPSYNVAPTSASPVYTHHKVLRDMKWGLIPYWVSDVSKSQPYKTFNARCENISSSKMWTAPCKRKRCVVPVSGYFEWQTKGKRKIPYYLTRRDSELMFLAGMYDYVQSENLYTFTIITAPAPSNLVWLHTRMPVVLNRGSKEWATWLDTSKTDWDESELQKVLEAQCNEDELEWWQVSSDVGKVSNNGKYLITPAKSSMRDFFKKENKSSSTLVHEERKPHVKEEEEEPQLKPNKSKFEVKLEEAEEKEKPIIREEGDQLEKGLNEQIIKKKDSQSVDMVKQVEENGDGQQNHKRKIRKAGIQDMLRNAPRKRVRR